MKTLDELCSDTSLSFCYLIPGNRNIKKSNTFIEYDDIDSFADLLNGRNIYIGSLPSCSARSFTLMNTIITQPGALLVNIISFLTILAIIFFIKRKYTAVGRAEICYLYYLFAVFLVLSVVVENGVVPKSSTLYTLHISLQLCALNGSCAVLALVGVLPFKLWEDGTFKSKFFVRFISSVIMIFTFLYSFFCLKETPEDKNKTLQTSAIIVSVYVINSVFVAIFIFCEFLTSILILKNLWILGSLTIGIVCFFSGQILAHFFSTTLCEKTNHYLDGMFPMAISNLISYMMIYKCWAISTVDDLEFGVNINANNEHPSIELFEI